MCLTVPWGGATRRIPENLSNLQNCIMPCVQDACACSALDLKRPSRSRLPHQAPLLTKRITSRMGVGEEGTPHLNKF